MSIINTITKVEQLRALMKEKGIHAYIVPSGDPHQSEYVADHYATRAFISGFTGSSGTAVVTLNEAGVWTDGRYFVQAEDELKTSAFKLYRMGEEGVPSILDFLKETLPEGSAIGFDGRVISLNYFRELKKTLESKNFKYEMEHDLIDEIWHNRPSIPKTQIIEHDVKYTGASREEKLTQVIDEMKKLGATHYLISGLDDIAWLFNIRGRDIRYNPLTIAYAVISESNHTIFIDDEKLSSDIKSEFNKANINVLPYDAISNYLQTLQEGVVLIDPAKTNVQLYYSINVKTIDELDITTKLKAVKNETEIQHVRNCMVRDGVAMVQFINWIKKIVKTTSITEIEAATKLEEFRRKQDLFYDLSFTTISAYKANGSLPHYRATLEKQATIEPKSLYLVDSGGQYYDGTTDITRTLAVGELTDEERTDFTLVLKGMINLTAQRFLYGTTGANLDILARIPLWNAGLDYKHGTGHGIGFFLNVHEGPQSISQNPINIILKKGMMMSNEPGVYKPNKHGIRIENIIVVKEDEKTEYGGQFMCFETLTLCPIDLDAIDASLLTSTEINWLNNYHKQVYENLAPHLEGDDLEFLKQATKSL